MASPTEISIQQLARLIGTPECPQLLDVRIDADFNDDPRMLPSARRLNHLLIGDVSGISKERPVVVYCQKGLKLSSGAAAVLRHKGYKAESVAGGQFAWRDANLPMINTKMLPALAQGQSSRWVCRHRPKIDRIACPWLIRRFVDPQAQFLYVTSSQVLDVADKFDAIAFDDPEGVWSHQQKECSFDTFLSNLGLNSKPLKHLALIVRAADTNSLESVPEAAGLLAASLGLSRMYRDDLQQLESGMHLYDAFYRWARDATNETHDWPSNPPEVK